MNPTIIRRVLWVVAVLAFAYTVYAYWEWRPLEILITAGIFIICVPIDIVLAREECERRARARTPFGPLQKWGTRTYSEESPFWTMTTHTPAASVAIIEGGESPAWEAAMAPDRRPRAPWWRRLYRRLVPAWWITALSPLLLMAAVPFAGPADALTVYPHVTITVVWTGDPQCIAAHGPNGFGGLEDVAMCSPEQWWTQSYQTPSSGQWIGVDPEMSGAETLSCTLSVDGDVILNDFAVRDDGHEVTCLGRW